MNSATISAVKISSNVRQGCEMPCDIGKAAPMSETTATRIPKGPALPALFVSGGRGRRRSVAEREDLVTVDGDEEQRWDLSRHDRSDHGVRHCRLQSGGRAGPLAEFLWRR